jgi:hypothetical protein
MKLFNCTACSAPVFFENFGCGNCGRRLGYLPDENLLCAVEEKGAAWARYDDAGLRYKFCRNADYGCCNWLVSADVTDIYCRACRHNHIVPDLSFEPNIVLWRKIENAKHRLFYTLLRFRLPLQTRAENDSGLIFEFLGDGRADLSPVLTGHESGQITIALAEADDAERERRRAAMREPYRTLLGHFRHEIGHYYWDKLVKDTPLVEEFREVFGDERLDYNAALNEHYARGAPPDWQNSFVSEYATTHPWEDFAETWAHYFHIVDTLEMASRFGLGDQPLGKEHGLSAVKILEDPYSASHARQLVDSWLPLTIALNSLNRCMGQSDLYPFVISPQITGKLELVRSFISNVDTQRASVPL